MNHITTRLMPFLFLLFIGVGKAYCDTTNPYLSTTGGTYKLMESLDDYQDKNIIIIASHSTNDDGDMIRIMTTAMTDSKNAYTGYFGYYTQDEYSSSMPSSLTITTVNSSINDESYYPFEYVANDKSTTSVKRAALQDINKKYVYNQSTATDCSLTNSYAQVTCAWSMSVSYGDSPLFLDPTSNRKLQCIDNNSNYPLGQFTNNSLSYFNRTYIYKKVHALSIGSTGYATLYYGNHDLIVPSSLEGLEAYTYRLNDNTLETSHTFKAGDIIPAGTAVVCKGTPNTTYYLDIIANATKASTLITDENYCNLLLGTNTDSITKGTNCRFFYLTDGSTGFGFRYRTTGGTEFINKAHKAYLCIPESAYTSGSAKAIEFLLPQEGDVTSVQATETTTAPLHNECYDLSGKRINEPDKGTFIKQGKKFLKQ